MFQRLANGIGGWIAPVTDPGPAGTITTPAGRIGSLLMIPGADSTRFEYLNAQGGTQDIRYQISSGLGVAMEDVEERVMPNGLVGFFARATAATTSEGARVKNTRASYLLNTMVFGPCYFLHVKNDSLCAYGDARPELLCVPANKPRPLIQANQLDPGPIKVDPAFTEGTFGRGENSIVQVPTPSPTPTVQEAPQEQAHNNAGSMYDRPDLQLHMDNNTPTLHTHNMPDTARNTRNTHNNTYTTQHLVAVAVRKSPVNNDNDDDEPVTPPQYRKRQRPLERQTVRPVRRSSRLAKREKRTRYYDE